MGAPSGLEGVRELIITVFIGQEEILDLVIEMKAVYVEKKSLLEKDAMQCIQYQAAQNHCH